MGTPRFDLVDVLHTLRNNRKTIIIVSVLAAVVGGAIFLISNRKYRAVGSFMMANPLYTDRNNLFQETGVQFVDYFAGDDDVDKILAVVEADTVKYAVAAKLNLAAHYKLDMSKPKDAKDLIETIKDNFKVTRSEYNGCEISFDDTDPKVAADVVNESMNTIEQVFRGYYVGQRRKLANSLRVKLVEIDSSIEVLTDTLAKLRDKYQIYDIINPARKNLMASSIHSNGKANFGWALEQVQNLESVKDQLVTDRAKYTSVINEYSATSTADDDRLMHVMTTARVPAKPKQPGLLLTVLSCGLIGFFFSGIYLLIRTYYRTLIAVKR